MNDIQKNFLESIRVNIESYPASFYGKIKNIPLSNIEIEYCAVPNYCNGKIEKFHIRDVVGTNHERYAGKTKYPFRKMLKLAIDGIIGFSSKPLKIIGGIGMLSIMISFAVLIYSIFLYAFFSSSDRIHLSRSAIWSLFGIITETSGDSVSLYFER